MYNIYINLQANKFHVMYIHIYIPYNVYVNKLLGHVTKMKHIQIYLFEY